MTDITTDDTCVQKDTPHKKPGIKPGTKMGITKRGKGPRKKIENAGNLEKISPITGKPVRAKFGGRKKGAYNKNSLVVKDGLDKMGVDIIKETITSIMQIDEPALKAQNLLALMKFIYPVLKPKECDTTESVIDIDHSKISTEDLIKGLNNGAK